MPDINILRVENLVLSYRSEGDPAVNGISFTADSTETLGILGGNGAGKTSTLKALAGVLPVTSGSVFLNDLALTNNKEADIARKEIGYAPDIGGLVKQATVQEHIELVQSLRKNDFGFSQLEVKHYVELMGLSQHASSPVGGFSHGMARRLSVLLAFLSAHSMLILDEPFDGVDPLGVDATMQLIAEAKSKGIIVIISTHLLSLLTQAADRILVMNKGHQLEVSDANVFLGDGGSQHYKDLLLGDVE